MKLVNKYGYLLFTFFYLTSCFEDKYPVMNDVIGTYLFTYPSGEIETISLSNDSTYEQYIYKNELDYKNLSPIFNNKSNKWRLNKSEIEFERWLAYCEFGSPKNIRKFPSLLSSYNCLWVKQSSNRKALLDFSWDNEYWFFKIN